LVMGPPCELVPHERSVLRESVGNFLYYFQCVACFFERASANIQQQGSCTIQHAARVASFS
jgi:hypothetical protein